MTKDNQSPDISSLTPMGWLDVSNYLVGCTYDNIGTP